MKAKTLQEQIDEFYKETGYQLEVKDGKPYYDGNLNLDNKKKIELPDNLIVGGELDLYGTNITELPDNLIVGGELYLYGANITELPDNLVVGGWLDLSHTKVIRLPNNLVVGGSLSLDFTNITELPKNLIVGGGLGLFGTNITKLPDNLVVGRYLELGTKIAELADNLVVGGSLDLGNTKVAKLPENLVVGGNLYLRDSKVAELPDNLVVGGGILGISDNPIKPTLTKETERRLQKIGNFMQWNAGGKTYIKVDGIFSVVDSHKGNVWRTHRIGKDETLYVVTDGEGHYTHGNTLKEAKADLIYKINDRDTSLYENLSLDDEVSFEDAIAMYRTITGACSAGTRGFVESRLPEPHKERYTIREIITLTDGEYGSERLKEFFKASK